MLTVSDTEISQIPLYTLVHRILKQERLTFAQITRAFSDVKDEQDPLLLRQKLISFAHDALADKQRRPLSKTAQKRDQELKKIALNALRADFHPDVFKTKESVFAYWLLHDISYPEERKGQCPFFDRGPSFYSFARFLEQAQNAYMAQEAKQEHNRLMRLLERKIPRPRER